jgi:hypothetical protein
MRRDGRTERARLRTSRYVDPRGARARDVRLALSVNEACAALAVSWDFWHQHVEPEIRLVRRGRRKLIPVRELERWLDENAERVLE